MPRESTAGGGPRVKVNGDTRRRTSPKGMRAPVERIEPRLVADLVPYANNPRLHSEEQVQQIAASMREFGQAQIVVVDEDGEIIAGHGRVLAARRLDLKKLLVGVAVGWTDAQKRAYRIADNKIALNSEWDGVLLKAELVELRDEGFALDLTGFDSESLVEFLADPTAPGEFKAYGEDVPTDHQCPKCGYKWSGGA
jgi:ParB-like chromosome segregation protein Spo0J